MSPGAAALYVSVIGPGVEATDDDLAVAHDVGRLLAERGVTVVTGGLGGVMRAAARGASEAGGTVIGLLPGDDRADGNEYLTIAISTGLGEGRNVLVVRAADAIVTVGGSWGTLSEMALALRTGKPTVSVGGWGVVTTGAAPTPTIVECPDAEAAVSTALALVSATAS